MQEDPASALQQRLAYGQPNPARAAGDERGLALKPLHDATLLLNPRRPAAVEATEARA